MIAEQRVIDKYLGVPYKLRGRDLSGVDCWGLIKAIYKDLGIDVWDIEEEYDEDWSWKGRNYFIENYHKEWIKTFTPFLFDVVLLKSRRNGIANHGGVILSNRRFIHCCKGAGTIITRLDDKRWDKRIDGYFHLKARNNDNS